MLSWNWGIWTSNFYYLLSSIRPAHAITSSVNGSVSISHALTRAVNIHVCFLTLRRHLGRQGRCGDCRVGDKVVVVIVDSTAIGAAPGALTVAARAYPPNWLFTLPLPLILNLHIYFHLALRQQLRVLNIMLNGLYLYQWLYVDSCFIHCNYQEITLLLWARTGSVKRIKYIQFNPALHVSNLCYFQGFIVLLFHNTYSLCSLTHTTPTPPHRSLTPKLFKSMKSNSCLTTSFKHTQWLSTPNSMLRECQAYWDGFQALARWSVYIRWRIAF